MSAVTEIFKLLLLLGAMLPISVACADTQKNEDIDMRKMEGTTQLVDEGGSTRIVYHTDTIPGYLLPPIVGKLFIEHQTREQFREMRDEVLKRKRSTVAMNN